MAEDILGGRLSIEDAFSSPLDKFANQILGAENRYKKFADGIINSNRKIENSMNQTFSNLEKIASKFATNENKTANTINNAANKVRQNQEKNIDGLIQRYGKLGEAIKGAYSAGDSVNPPTPRGGSSSEGSSSDSLKDFVQSFLQSGIGGVIGKLGLIGAGITAGITVMKTLNNFMEQGFDILNKVSDNLFSAEGIKDAIQESMGFETGRMKLNLFYGGEEKGLEAYQNATNVTQKTFAGERDLIEISSKLGSLGITPSQKQLEKLVDVAGSRPEVSTDHIGLAVKEAVEGRVMMLQMYGINNRNLKKFYDGLKKSDPKEYKELKGALSKKGTADNPQKYFNLLTDYIEKSHVNGYAETYAKTLQGKLERLGNIWELRKAEIMGIDIGDGTSKDGGVFSAVGKMVDNLKNKLDDKGTIDSLQKVGKSFGDAFASIGNAFNKAVTPETIEKVASAIAKIGDSLAKMIDKFVSSGELDKLIEALPLVVDKVVTNEAIDKTTEFKVGADIAQGNYWTAGFDKFKGTVDWGYNAFGNNKNEEGAMDDDWSTKLFYTIQGLSGNNIYTKESASEYNDKFFLTDANASTAIDKNANLNSEQKQSIKDLISSDDLAKYNITIHSIQANNFDEIMKSIKEAAANRK